MELTHLKYFITVAEELHFGRAAKRLHIAQPPLSQQIMRLEDELNVKLFKRSSRHVELSEAGKVLLPEARVIVKHANKAESVMRTLAGGKSGYLSVAFNEPSQNTFLPEVVKAYLDRYPEVELSLSEQGIDEQFNALDEKSIHLAFMRLYGQDMGNYNVRLLYSERYVAALPCGHPLCSQKEISLNMLDKKEMILFLSSLHPKLRQRFEECFSAAGAELNVIQEINSKRMTLALVATGMALSIVPESSIIQSDELEFRPLAGDLPLVEIAAVWNKGNDSPLLKNFLKMLDKHITK